MELTQKEIKIIYDWPNKDEYLLRKELALNEYIPIFEKKIMDNPVLFTNLNDRKLKDLSESMALFYFGISMVYQKFGKKYNEIPLVLTSKGMSNMIFAVLEYPNQPDKTEYAINPLELTQFVLTFGKEGRINGRVAGIERPTLKEVCEISGVEEAAHFLYIKEKGNSGKPKMENQPSSFDYYTSDLERRALIWKLSYLKKYMPRYLNDLSFIEVQVSQARKNS